LPLPGVRVGDLGLKPGWNWIDHGFVMFNKVRIPREDILDKYQDVSPTGQYVLKVGENDRFGLTLGSLSGGRVGIAFNAVEYGKLALTISVRYSLVRCQFGAPKKPEQPVLDYQIQQYRLLPFLAGTFAMSCFCNWLCEKYESVTRLAKAGNVTPEFIQMNQEMHALSSGAKPVTTWYTRDIIQTSRECCGGHGFSSYSRLGLMREENDPSLTYEGDNNVLIQQLARYLIQTVQRKQMGKPVASPFGSVNYLNNIASILNSRSTSANAEQFLNGGYVAALEWRVSYLLQESATKMMKLSAEGDVWSTWNNSQIFYLQSAAKAHMELLIVQSFLNRISQATGKFASLKPVLQRLCDLYAVSCICNGLDVLLEGGYFSSQHSKMVKELVLDLCSKLQPDAVAIIDAIAIPDKALWSTLGQSDGEVYKHHFGKIQSAKGVYERPSYWQLLRTPVIPGSSLSKL